MSSTLSSYTKLPAYQVSSVSNAVSTAFSDVAATRANFEAFKAQLNDKGSVKNYLLLGVLVILLHGLVVVAYINRDTSSILVPVKHEVAIEFIKAEVIPPPPIEPPKPPPPPPPKVQHTPPPPPQAAPALRTPPAEQNITASDITVAENTTAPKSTAPVEAAPAPVVPPAKVEEPVTEATASAAYLNNPKPDYPAAAARMNWGGTVILRVRVLADGRAESVSVKKSSGRKVLDDSAVSAVQKWTFVPSKRGSTAIDGWATVPIIFNSEQ